MTISQITTQTHLYTAPSGLTRPATIDAVDGDLAFIAYTIQDSDIEMTGWVLLTDLTPLAIVEAVN